MMDFDKNRMDGISKSREMRGPRNKKQRGTCANAKAQVPIHKVGEGNGTSSLIVMVDTIAYVLLVKYSA